MKNLQLSLKKQWFEMTNSDGKNEEYREITPYWCARLLVRNEETRPEKLSTPFWRKYLQSFQIETMVRVIKSNCDIHRVSFKKFDVNIMTLGYPKSTDISRIKKFKHAGIEIRTGNPDWGAEPDKLYFVIKHGNKIN